ncbi:glycosyltransferase [Pseudobutyrivibrio sp.]|uniref:glycosyltransferase n=1 Tax=Pseudobutyrivibrio sp. TaxID=2014367 RepID=UPI00386D1A90
MKELKVLHVVTGMGMGGIENFLINVYRNIDRSKVSFDFIIHKKTDDGFENEIRELGGSIYYFYPISPKNIGKYMHDVRCFIRDHEEYSIIHIHNRVVSAIWAFFAKKYNRISIVHSHSTGNGLRCDGIIKNMAQYPSRFIANYCMGCSQQANEWMFGKLRSASKTCFFVRNGIDTDKFVFSEENRVHIRSQLKIADDTIVIGTIGRLVPQKNLPLLIDAFVSAKQIRENLMLIIVGDGPLYSEVEKKIVELGMSDSIKMLGNRQNVNELLSAFDCFALTSICEGFGIVLIEAQAEGLPIIISPAISEEACITDDVIRIGSYEKDAWAEAMIHMKQKCRLDRRSEIRGAGYDIKAVSSWLSDFYQNCLPNGAIQ